ncbi:hypothetical protein ACFFUT_02415 [Pseudohalocynthiibacter aestuariivivens]|jgi:hypothetical protein|uniref:Peptidase S1 n=1 Tax=Pseudohalocynthiibacter aestuariivivens TaxID=1591409 RepID=A0ABV5JB41_9RHOB|nr:MULTISPECIES: hypothetical protein [Pseudohalocynthiibacter]MBS9715805.1 hypothetical protein [Pseudohalocynthiibacter aestuariivivens]MCK0101418.1 hypothetical protein [Pseudohalocynthiibacter sp. F2068]
MKLKTLVLAVATPLALSTIGSASSASAACPDWRDEARTEIHSNAQQLYTRHSYSVLAGGDVQVDYCRVSDQTPEPATGFVADRPDFEVYYDGSSDYALEISVTGECDTTLLVNTANENWFFDDDAAGNGNPRIYLTSPSEGWYDIWVGTFNNSMCDAELHLETY